MDANFYHWIPFLELASSLWCPSRLIGAPISAIPTIFMLDALPGTTLPFYPGLGQAPNMLACIPCGLVTVFKHWWWNTLSDFLAMSWHIFYQQWFL